jgi:hypothetical protein
VAFLESPNVGAKPGVIKKATSAKARKFILIVIRVIVCCATLKIELY